MTHAIDGIHKARRLLETPHRSANWWAGLAASALCALGAVLLAGAIIMGPGVDATVSNAAFEVIGAD